MLNIYLDRSANARTGAPWFRLARHPSIPEAWLFTPWLAICVTWGPAGTGVSH